MIDRLALKPIVHLFVFFRFFAVTLIRLSKFAKKSFSVRGVVASQFDKPILTMSASFQKHEAGISHQCHRPEIPGPDGLTSNYELNLKVADRIPESIRDKFTCEQPIEVRVVEPQNYFNPKIRLPQKYVWLKSNGPMPDNPLLHRLLLTYASDFELLSTSLLPHKLSLIDPEMQVASLDHAMWFHRDFRFDPNLLEN